MIHRQSISINDYAQAKEAELNFWVAVLGIATGIVIGFLLLRSFFQVTLSENTLVEREPQANKMFQQDIMSASYYGDDTTI